MEDLRQKLLEENKKLDDGLQEYYTSNKPDIDAFFEKLQNGGIKNSAKLEITGMDLGEVMNTIEILKKSVDNMQELSIVTSTCMKKLQAMVYSTAKNSRIKTELDVE